MKNKKKGLVLLDKFIISFISLVTVLAIGTVVWAVDRIVNQSVNIENVENLTINIPENSVVTEGDFSLGAGIVETLDKMSISTTDLSNQAGINIQDRLRYGDAYGLRGRTYKTKIVDFTDATSTPAVIQNREGRQIWVTGNTCIQNLGNSTSTVKMQVGTSSSKFITVSADALFSADANTGDGGLASILWTGDIATDGATNPTTTTSWCKKDYEGADTRDASGTRFDVPVKAGEWIVVTATSTNQSAVTSTNSFFDGRLFVEYYYWDPKF